MDLNMTSLDEWERIRFIFSTCIFWMEYRKGTFHQLQHPFRCYGSALWGICVFREFSGVILGKLKFSIVALLISLAPLWETACISLNFGLFKWMNKTCTCMCICTCRKWPWTYFKLFYFQLWAGLRFTVPRLKDTHTFVQFDLQIRRYEPWN